VAEDLSGKSTSAPRIVVFGATGHLGRELIDRLAESRWPVAELVCVASAESAGVDVEFRGESLDVLIEPPRLQGYDLIFVCTPEAVSLDIVREALRAEVPCIDCSGSLVGRDEVPMPVRAAELAGEPSGLAGVPLMALASGTTIAWTPILEAFASAGGLRRVVGTVLASASAQGRRGVAALSEESIALFNQSEPPESGPAGQPVAFDVIPDGGIDGPRVTRELQRLFGSSLGVALSHVQVPTFVGEGATLAIELEAPRAQEDLESLLAKLEGLTIMPTGPGSRGLTAVEPEAGPAPSGPTLRDSAGRSEVLVGRLRPDPSLEPGRGWLLWLSADPLGLAAEHALRLAARRLGLS
jgi:aspartate-semialdehyde dehydrogenase